MEFSVTAGSGESVTVQCDNWMMALGKAMAFFQMDATAMVRWVCTPGPGGEVTVEDPVNQHSWVVRPTRGVIKVVATTPQREVVETEPESPRVSRQPTPIFDESDPPPSLEMPLQASFKPPSMDHLPPPLPSSEDLAERLFELSMDIAEEDQAGACRKALALCSELIPVEAGSVARGSIADFHLTITAATGPVADKLQGRIVPFGEGIVGLAFDARIPVHVKDATTDERHNPAFDQELGFVTREVLCVPILHGEEVYGVLQLINPTKGHFEPEHVEVVQGVARTLANAFASDQAFID